MVGRNYLNFAGIIHFLLGERRCFGYDGKVDVFHCWLLLFLGCWRLFSFLERITVDNFIESPSLCVNRCLHVCVGVCKHLCALLNPKILVPTS